jgi:hypothetical protein
LAIAVLIGAFDERRALFCLYLAVDLYLADHSSAGRGQGEASRHHHGISSALRMKRIGKLWAYLKRFDAEGKKK